VVKCKGAHRFALPRLSGLGQIDISQQARNYSSYQFSYFETQDFYLQISECTVEPRYSGFELPFPYIEQVSPEWYTLFGSTLYFRFAIIALQPRETFHLNLFLHRCIPFMSRSELQSTSWRYNFLHRHNCHRVQGVPPKRG
jgi:hypothetical protein